MGFLTLPVALKGLNVYNEPTEVNAYSTNYQKTLKMDDCVIIWNNISRTPIEPIVMEFAKRLYHVERALDINIKQQKFPYFILSDETQRLTFQNAMEQYDGNEMFIFGNKKGFDKEAFQVLNTPVPFVADKLWEYKHNLWNEAMTFLGIGNAQQQKKERMVTDEVSANDEQIMSSRFVMLHERQKACEKINEKFGLDIWVDFKLNVQQEEQEMEGDGENEES
jgi:hypothetical protein